MINAISKNNLQRKWFIWLIGYSWLLREARAGAQNRKLEAGTQEEIITECCLLARIYWFAWLPYLTRAHLSMSGTAHSRQGPPLSDRSQENYPIDINMDQSDGINSSIKILSSHESLDLSWQNLTKKKKKEHHLDHLRLCLAWYHHKYCWVQTPFEKAVVLGNARIT